jgi:hypothetical protein
MVYSTYISTHVVHGPSQPYIPGFVMLHGPLTALPPACTPPPPHPDTGLNSQIPLRLSLSFFRSFSLSFLTLCLSRDLFFLFLHLSFFIYSLFPCLKNFWHLFRIPFIQSLLLLYPFTVLSSSP